MKNVFSRRRPAFLAAAIVFGLLSWSGFGPFLATDLSAGQSLKDAGIPPTERPVVVELYTSQGCYSCPPADRLLGELADLPEVLALSFHVDYWDYIGWKDVFASPAHSDRQRQYSRALSLRYVYTPQMVVDGRYDVAGSRGRQVVAAIEKAARNQVSLDIEIDVEENLVRLPTGRAPKDGATVWLVMYDAEHSTEITRGENTGKTLTYHNVVRDYRELGVWNGEALEFPLDLAAASERDGCAVLVQQDRHGPIIGAVVVDLPGPS